MSVSRQHLHVSWAVGAGCLAAVAGAMRPPPGALAQGGGAAEAMLVIAVSADGEDGGAERVGELHAGRLAHGRASSFSALLRATRCYRLVARAGAGMQNVDVSISRGRAQLARDAGIGQSAVARYCTGGHQERVRLSVSAFRGSGRFAAGLFLLPEGSSVAAPAGGQGDSPGARGESPLERLASLVQRYGHGMRPVTAPARETLAQGEAIERVVPLTPGRCYRVLAASGGAIEDADLALRGPTSDILQRDASEDATPTLGVLRPLCPAAPGEHRLVLRAVRGGGALAWQVLGSGTATTAGQRAAAPRHRLRVGGPGHGFIANRLRERHRAAGEGRPPVTTVASGSLQRSAQRDVVFRVAGGHCYVALAVGMPSVRDLDLRVVDAYGNERATDGTHDATPAVRFCPSVAGDWKVRVQMFNGYGQYGLQVFGSEQR